MTSSSEIFGSHVLSLDLMKKRLPKATYHALIDTIDGGTPLQMEHADAIAHAMMEWALEKGVTHYTHWFQPMGGLTAQKHDSFLDLDSEMKPIERFSGSQLIQSEPDASSFPSGGMRSTFEARGYTAWDPSSPVFVMTHGKVPFLCIPSVFFTYTGHAMDKKTPLLRSLKALGNSAGRALALLTGQAEKVIATVGHEQEYFLVNHKLYEQRPDLLMAGRTLVGCRPAKGQQMEDHYFGSIKDKVLEFMQEVESRLYRLGVPCKTRHNEVAPNQFEMAPVFQDANLSADANQLIMEVLKKTASEFGLAALLHEKPFEGVNGSGKHINWSLATESGTNLLEPGNKPHSNLVFLYFLVAVVNAIHKRGDLLRSTIAHSGNDHRLGANEAPPAIMSVFLGSNLTDILDKIEMSENLTQAVADSIDLGLTELPKIKVDNTDRNRTSPFAFTGNKFEFRACGSSQSISFPIAILNGALTESLNEMNMELEKLGSVNEKNLFAMLRPFISKSKNIRFEGNNYSDEWAAEAEARGLSNFRTTPEAMAVWESKDVQKFATEIGLLSKFELEARYNINLEHYSKLLGIEANTLLRMVDNHVLPAAFRYQSEVAGAVQTLKLTMDDLGLEGLDNSVALQSGYLKDLAATIGQLLETRGELDKAIESAETFETPMAEARFYSDKVRPLMERTRAHCDALESLIDTELWTLPSYHQLLFLL